MIEGIDIFQPRENGLPDFSKISVGQIFNGSVAAGMNQKLDPYGFNDKKEGYTGVAESPNITTTIDPRTGQRVEVRKAKPVDDLLSGGSAARRGHSRVNGRRGGGGGGSYLVPGAPPPDLPDNPSTPTDPSLLDPNNILGTPPPTPEWHPPMLPPEQINLGVPNLFPPELTPGEKKTAALQKLPTMLLEELKDLHLV